MLHWTRPFTRRAILASALAAATITAAGAATHDRLAVTQSAGGGSEGATEFLQTSAGGSAVQAQVGGSAYTGLPYPFGLFGFYDGPSSTFGIGTLGISTTGYGVAGAAMGSNTNPAVLAYAEGSGPGLEAVTTKSSNTSPAIFAETATGANADAISASIANTRGSNSGFFAISGDDDASVGNANGGVIGTSKGDSYGVAGMGFIGVLGVAAGSVVTSGVYGESDVGTGFSATSDSGTAIVANTGPPGIGGAFQQEAPASPAPSLAQEDGVYASAQNGAGLFTYSLQDPAIAAEMGCNVYLNNVTEIGQNCSGLFVQEDGTNGYPLMVYEPNSTISTQSCSAPTYPFYVDSAGNVFQCGATISSNVYQRNANPASDAVTYAAKQTESTVEDFGRAQLVNGSASVALAQDFKQTIDVNSPYMVFTMPHGDSHRLYLASQNQTGFVIRESRGGHSTLTFDYRIVARPYGRRPARLPHESQVVPHRPIERPSARTSYAQLIAAARARNRALFRVSNYLSSMRRLSMRHRNVPQRIPANFASTLVRVKSGAVDAATAHRLAVTPSAGGGSGGATDFLQTTASDSALQSEVAASAYTGLPDPFGLFGFYHGSSSTFGIGTLGISTTGYGVAGAGEASPPAILAYGEGVGPALEAVTTSASNTSPAIYAAPAPSANADGIDAVINTTSSTAPHFAIVGDDESSEPGNGGVSGTSSGDSYGVVGIVLPNGNGGPSVQTGVSGTSIGASGGQGVSGDSDVGTGVSGVSTSGVGVTAVSNTSTGASFTSFNTSVPSPAPYVYEEAGLYATAQNGAGIYAYSSQDPAIAAESECNVEIDSPTEVGQNCSGLFIQEDGTNGYPLLVWERESTQTCPNPKYPFFVNSAGDLLQCGKTMMAQVYQRSSNPASDTVTYTAKQTEATVEDFGTAQLVDGSANVALARDFRETIDANAAYLIFAMPHGDSRGLYIASQDRNGFVIRESQGGRSTMTFDYRIVARPYGGSDARLPHEAQVIADGPIDRPTNRSSYAQLVAAAQARNRGSFDASRNLAMKRLLSLRSHRYVPPTIPASFATR